MIRRAVQCGQQSHSLPLLSIHYQPPQRRSTTTSTEDKIRRDGHTGPKPRLHHLAHKAKAHRGTLGRARYAFGHTACHPCQPDSLTLQVVVESRFKRKKSRGGVDVFQFAQTVEHDAWEDNELRQNLQVGRPMRVFVVRFLILGLVTVPFI